MPISRNVHEPATGRLVRVQSVSGGLATAQVVKGYDSLGRQTSYTDADGVTSTTTYDLLGRVETSTDGKATRTYAYDGGTERRGLPTSVTDSQAGVFAGTYDADGTITSETWPNGVQVATEVDETGTQVGLTYTRPGCPSTDCGLYTESVTESVHGQWRARSSSLSEQTYTYDQASRLTSIRDVIGGQCTNRSYGFSTSSNRTTLTVHGPAADGACQTTTAASSRTWTYDTADRVNSTGYGYDALGRTSTVPAVDTAGSGNATVTYHSTDLVDTISHGGRTTDYVLDVTGERIRSWTDTAGGATPAVHHYDGEDDSPSWTQENPDRFTRPVPSLSGMGGIFDSDSGQVDWQITNLHGDLVAAINGDDQGLSRTSEASEYGTPRNTDDIGNQRYGWVGAKQRAADTPSGIILMGVRLYNSVTGRFLQVDPIEGGSCNAYEYACADPINSFDLDGKRWCWKVCGWGRNSVWRMAFHGGRMALHTAGFYGGFSAARGGYRGLRSSWKTYKSIKKNGFRATWRPIKRMSWKQRFGYGVSAGASWMGYHDFRNDWRGFRRAWGDTKRAGGARYCRIASRVNRWASRGMYSGCR